MSAKESLLAPSPRLDAPGSVESMIAGWTFLVCQYPRHEIRQEGPVRTFFSQENNAFLNILLIDRAVPDSEAFSKALERVRAEMTRCRFGSMVASVPQWYPEGSDAIFAQHGLVPALDMWGMVTTALSPPRRIEPDLDYRLIRDPQTSIDIGLVNAAAYAMSAQEFAVTHNLHSWSGEHFGIVGYDGDTPVTAALTYIQDEQIYVGWVATLPDRYGQGLGEAAMRRAIAAAQEAARRPLPIWLHATEMGRPLYRSMGFADAALMRFHVIGNRQENTDEHV